MMTLYVCVLVLGIMLFVAAAQVRRTRPAPLVWRPVLVHPHSRVNYLYALDWSAQQFTDTAARLRGRDEVHLTEYFEDFAHIRALEERLEIERFTQLRNRKASVRAWAKVRAA